MTSADFPQRNVELAKDQPEYETLYSHVDQSRPETPVTCCFDLTDEEIEEIVRTRKIWHTQWTFGHPFQPISMTTSNPFQ